MSVLVNVFIHDLKSAIEDSLSSLADCTKLEGVVESLEYRTIILNDNHYIYIWTLSKEIKVHLTKKESLYY